MPAKELVREFDIERFLSTYTSMPSTGIDAVAARVDEGEEMDGIFTSC
jgi:hypothetical protein